MNVAAEQPRTAEEWIEWAGARRIGRVEFREVTMAIGTGRGARTLRLRTLRASDGGVARTLFCVMEPWPLRNINYVVTEHRGRIEPFEITLYLPYVGGSVRRLDSHRRVEGHLGSDFSYDDLRTWPYQEGHRYELVGFEGALVRVRGYCLKRQRLVRHGAAPFDVSVGRATGFIHRIEYRSADGSSPVRVYSAEKITQIDGVLIPEQMRMTDLVRQHTTVLLLERAWYDRAIDYEIFDDASRERSWDYLKSL